MTFNPEELVGKKFIGYTQIDERTRAFLNQAVERISTEDPKLGEELNRVYSNDLITRLDVHVFRYDPSNGFFLAESNQLNRSHGLVGYIEVPNITVRSIPMRHHSFERIYTGNITDELVLSGMYYDSHGARITGTWRLEPQ